MKKIILILCMTAAAAAVFASGAQEVNEEGVVELQRGMLQSDSYYEDLEKIEVQGTVNYDSPVPELVSGSKSYTLVVPGGMAYYGYISEGDRLKVKGYLVEDSSFGMPMAGGAWGRGWRQDFEALDGNLRILVETVEIDGTEYQLPWANDAGRFGACDSCGGFRDSRQGGRFGGRQRSF